MQATEQRHVTKTPTYGNDKPEDGSSQRDAEIYHEGLDASGRRAVPPDLSGDQMDEAGW